MIPCSLNPKEQDNHCLRGIVEEPILTLRALIWPLYSIVRKIKQNT